jgi:hypothetical protein
MENDMQWRPDEAYKIVRELNIYISNEEKQI